MNIKDITFGQIVYYPRWSKRVMVIGIDKKWDTVTIQDKDKNKTEVYSSELEKVIGDSDMSADDILKREG